MQSADSIAYILSCEIENFRRNRMDDSMPDAVSFFELLSQSADSLAAESSDSGNRACADAIIDVIYRRWGVGFDPDQDEPYCLLPHTIVQCRRGSCLGVSLLLLMLAERLGCPLYGVLLPGHFFVRFSAGNYSRNIEPNRAGFNHPDEYYRQRYRVAAGGWYDMRNLTKKEVLAVFYFNLGNIYRQRKRLKESLRCFRTSVQWLDGYAEAWGNMAISFDLIGRADSARAAFAKALSLRPDLPNLALNRGVFELHHRRFSDAREAFRQGLTHYPDDAGLYRGMVAAYRGMGYSDSAELMLSRMRASGQAGDSLRHPAVLVKQ